MTISAFITSKMVSQSMIHSWRSTIQETIKGGEKRSTLYTWPRVRLENNIQLISDEERRFIRTHLYRDLLNTWGFPFIHEGTTLTSQALAGQKILILSETAYRHFYDRRGCLLIPPASYDWESYEAAVIDTVDSGVQITLAENLSATWPVGTHVFPMYEYRIEDTQEIQAKIRQINLLTISATESFESARSFTYSIPASGADTYNGLDLFLIRPKNPMQEKTRFSYELLGFYGKSTAFSNYYKARFLFSREYERTSREDIWALLNFFDSKQGRLVSFYTPTWANDIIVTAAIGAADTTLTTKEIYLTAGEIVGRHLYIQLPDSSYVCREITARPSNTSITIDSAIGVAVSAENIANILLCFLYEVRFDADEIQLEYIADNVATTKLKFNSLW